MRKLISIDIKAVTSWAFKMNGVAIIKIRANKKSFVSNKALSLVNMKMKTFI